MLELIAKLASDAAHDDVDDTVTLPYALRQKSRQRVRLDSGGDAAIVLTPGTSVDDGDRLRAADGTIVRVRAAAEDVSTVHSADPLRLARACYHLGNRHVALQVAAEWVRYQPDHVLDDMVRGLGLTVVHESARFEPERGAYHAHSQASAGHTHGNDHEHGHDHTHGHGHRH